MAKFLGFDRANSKVVTVDTTSISIDDVGSAISNIETTNLFPKRSQNLAIMFRGSPYVLMLRTDNSVIVYSYDGSSWSASFQSAIGSDELKPIGLNVVNGKLVALWLEIGASGAVYGASTADGSSWTSSGTITTNKLAMTNIANGGSHSIVWNEAIFFNTDRGISYFKPATDDFGPIYTASSALVNSLTSGGCFTRWRDNLYFIRPASPLPLVYKLTSPFDPTSDPAAPQFVDQSATGFSDPGALTIGPDGGMYSAFVTPDNELSLMYTGANGTFFAITNETDFPLFTDQGSVNFPTGISSITDAGLSCLLDERRYSRPLPVIVVNDTSNADLTFLDCENDIITISGFLDNSGADLILQQDQRSERIYNDAKPSVFITAVTQVYPGNYNIVYTLIDSSSRTMSISPEYSNDEVSWLPMTQGSTGENKTQLTSSPSGVSHTFNWDARHDLNGEITFQNLRIVGSIGSA